MASISSLGAGSGMDLGSLLDKLQAAERKRLEPLTQQQSSYKSQLTGFGTLKGSLEKLQSASEELKKFDKLTTTKTTEEHKTFTASTDSKASPGNYEIEVKQLAKSQSLQTRAVSNLKEKLGTIPATNDTRTIIIEQKNEKGEKVEMKIPLSDDQTNLIEIRDAINKQEGNVSANILKATDDRNFLILTAKKAGTKSMMTIKVEGDDKLNALLEFPPQGDRASSADAMQEKVAAANAKLTVNGVEIERQTNEIKDAPEGVILNLKKVSEKVTETTKNDKGEERTETVVKTETLVVSRDIEPMKEAIKKWVDTYNELQTTFNSLTKFKAVGKGEAASKDNGVLLGDSTLRGIQNQLRHQLFAAQNVADIATLNKLGIKQKLDGTLEINNEKLEKNLKEKPANVKAFFMGDGEKTGFATQTYNMLKKTLDSHEGTIATATEGINKRLKTIESQVKRTNDNIDATMERYKRQFTELDKLVNSLNNTSSSLFQLLR
ncbi:flagellar filament capping protein FliD [Xenorhabdus szentirmaii]|uniref:Flagellar hook-associated protein 2 n=1 Tax=Xenorhabdus szentirmaii DSM 16338 TaxID=1427518 RepID=W1J3P7_9GAMM|nr:MULTISPECIES: flagellar filament capping protein FliD [Xenorhabdus]MBD2780387.1 flagellar filament capping protein FliD [Xenorhabdus sp. 38]MBD2794266.1 flagellar filament capping protein FliD [Xenorhabdus sp. CUL]MBD2803436.1 flagellar filament capping protein FliD [Xenorhabdus sp. ZM]MBD2822153.1 flagellar filament capping protein FliD [Xenorhabdus sp. 42]MBD2826962.1 flagellar filament capping protein FliD [Xenorhabdus sp. 5]